MSLGLHSATVSRRTCSLATALLLGIGVGLSGAAEYYVAPNGSDSNPGTQAKPFGTLERARAEIRNLKREGKPLPGELTVWVRGGDYFRTNASN